MENIISIIIPTYNRAHSLSDSILSVLDQSAGNWELIIVDDGSTDNTREVLKDYITDERITYHFQKNAGVSVARNKGVELCKGEYIIFLDSDDQFLPGLISSLNEIDFNKYELICWEVSKLIDGKSSLWKPQKLELIYNNITATFLAGSICYKKEIFLKTGGFDPEMTFGENYELGIRILNISGLKIKIIHQPFLRYSINTHNRSSSTDSKKIFSNLRLLHKHENLFRQDQLSLSRLQYQIGFLYEKQGKDQLALVFYRKALKTRPHYYKAFLKTIYLGYKCLFKNSAAFKK